MHASDVPQRLVASRKIFDFSFPNSYTPTLPVRHRQLNPGTDPVICGGRVPFHPKDDATMLKPLPGIPVVIDPVTREAQYRAELQRHRLGVDSVLFPASNPMHDANDHIRKAFEEHGHGRLEHHELNGSYTLDGTFIQWDRP